MKRRLTVYLSEALARSLKVRAAREGVTLSALIEEMLKAAASIVLPDWVAAGVPRREVADVDAAKRTAKPRS